MARREKGSGSVYQDSKRPGRYVGEITIAGKRRRMSGPSKTDVRAKLRALQDGAARGEVDDRKLTVADAIAQFLERDVPNRILAPSTIDLYRWTGDIIVAEIGKVRLANLTVGRVEKMLDRLASPDPNPLGRSTLMVATVVGPFDVRVVRMTEGPAVVADRRLSDLSRIVRSSGRGGRARIHDETGGSGSNAPTSLLAGAVTSREPIVCHDLPRAPARSAVNSGL